MTPELPAALVVDGLGKRYRAAAALDGVALAVAPGTVTAVLGPNGAGKTTLFEIVLGLRRPTSGRVEVLGTTPRAAVRGGRVGAMLQDGALPNGAKVGELIATASAWYRDPIPADRLAGVTGLGTLLGRRTETLSGGEAQRVRLALALAGNPRLLVLDEPTSALDPEARLLFWRGLDELVEHGAAVVFATHRFEEAESVAGRVVVLDHGRVAADAGVEDLRRAAGPGKVSFRLPREEQDRARLAAIPGVLDVAVSGDTVTLSTADADGVLRRVVAELPAARDFKVHGPDVGSAYFAAIGRGE